MTDSAGGLGERRTDETVAGPDDRLADEAGDGSGERG